MPPHTPPPIVGLIALLSAVARRFRHVTWLQALRFPRTYDPTRDRHLDHAWTDPRRRQRNRQAPPAPRFRELVREEFHAIAAEMPQMPPDVLRRRRRRANVVAGIKLVLLGLVLPFGYYALSVMAFFSTVSRAENIILLIVALVCMGAGITAIVRNDPER